MAVTCRGLLGACAVDLSLGVGLTVVVVGIPILLAMFAVTTGLASVERRLAAVRLGVEISTRNDPMPDTLREWVRRLVATLGTWKAMVYLVTKLFIGAARLHDHAVAAGDRGEHARGAIGLQSAGVYVEVIADAPVSYHPALYAGWDQLLVGLETVVTLSS